MGVHEVSEPEPLVRAYLFGEILKAYPSRPGSVGAEYEQEVTITRASLAEVGAWRDAFALLPSVLEALGDLGGCDGAACPSGQCVARRVREVMAKGGVSC